MKGSKVEKVLSKITDEMVAFLKAEMTELNRKCESDSVIKEFVSILLYPSTHKDDS